MRNFRPIALTDTISKNFCGVLNERLGQIFERCNVMGEEQNGFRRDRRDEDNMFVVNELIERARMNIKKYYFAFLDRESV